jgi:hypothetical protein
LHSLKGAVFCEGFLVVPLKYSNNWIKTISNYDLLETTVKELNMRNKVASNPGNTISIVNKEKAPAIADEPVSGKKSVVEKFYNESPVPGTTRFMS